MHSDIEASEIEAVHVVDIGIPKLKLSQFLSFIELFLIEFQFVGRSSFEPSEQSVNDVSWVDKLNDGRNYWIGDCEIEDFVDKSTSFVDVVSDVKISDDWDENGVH